MSTEIPNILGLAVRQYRHNFYDNCLLIGFDRDETINAVGQLEARIAKLKAAAQKAVDRHCCLITDDNGPHWEYDSKEIEELAELLRSPTDTKQRESR